MPSPFLHVPPTAWVAANDLAFAFRDRYPVSPGHTLVVTRRVVPTWFDATPAEQAAMADLITEVKRGLDAELSPHGYNVGFNAGLAAGQTVMHVHVHVIPRFEGDMPDPRGGVRHVIPWAANYLVGRPDRLASGAPDDPLLKHLRPLFSQATDIAVVAAFVQPGGLRLLEWLVRDAVRRGARVRLVGSDYMGITPRLAFRTLLDWRDELGEEAGGFEPRVIDHRACKMVSFHPKSWIFSGPDVGSAFVGSSNVSRPALATGVEWNLRLDRAADPQGWAEVTAAFEAVWEQARARDADWIAASQPAARVVQVRLFDDEPEPAPPPTPHEIQREALAALAATRAEGRTRALVVMATGLGKTLLAAFDVAARGGRTLFIAHRAEILSQARESFRRLLPDADFGWCVGEASDLDGDVVFASVQKLTQPATLGALSAASFDIVIVDEVHHASAPSYRKVLARLDPGFLLGLTATPDRADEADVLGLFDDNLAYRADVGEGIRRGFLAPFVYWGVKDTVDYAPIPWRNGRFDPVILSAAVETEARMATMWGAWRDHPGTRTIVFCCSISHARYVKSWLHEKGVRAACVHTGPDADDRAASLERLQRGEIDAVCAVDLLNEGVDIPAVDRVIMLRPTESPVVFLQQLGRGLRRAAGKAVLTVIDFVGNHRVSLDRVRVLLSMGGHPTGLLAFLRGDAEATLPPGCAAEIALEVKDMLARLLKPGSKGELERVFRELRASREERPTAVELVRMGLDPTAPRGGWFAFCAAEGALTAEEQTAVQAAGDWLAHLEATPMSKCFKMVVLKVLIDADALSEGMDLGVLAARSHALLRRSPELVRDVEGVAALPDAANPDPAKWAAYWRRNPIKAWAGGPYFAVEGGRLVSRIPAVPGLDRLTAELVDLRLAQYRARGVVAKAAPLRPALRLVPRPALEEIRVYPGLRAAAGASSDARTEVDADTAWLPGRFGPDAFAVRASGDSMDGGGSPIRDGDWVVFRWARGVGLGAAMGEVALVGVGDDYAGVSYHIKRVTRDALLSDNPAVGPMPVTADTAVYAVRVATVRPEDLAPPVGEVLDEDALSAAFGLPGPLDGRVGGHLFVRVPAHEAADRLARPVADRGVAETAYILAEQPDGRVRYCGPGRWRDGAWASPATDARS